jgi:hypothetical protein
MTIEVAVNDIKAAILAPREECNIFHGGDLQNQFDS